MLQRVASGWSSQEIRSSSPPTRFFEAAVTASNEEEAESDQDLSSNSSPRLKTC